MSTATLVDLLGAPDVRDYMARVEERLADDVAVHDIGLRMHRNEQGQIGFEVLVGGGLGRTPIIGVTVRDFLPEFAKLAKEANRDVPVTIWGAKDSDMLKADRDAGVVRVIISLESAKADEILPVLDKWAKEVA